MEDKSAGESHKALLRSVLEAGFPNFALGAGPSAHPVVVLRKSLLLRWRRRAVARSGPRSVLQMLYGGPVYQGGCRSRRAP